MSSPGREIRDECNLGMSTSSRKAAPLFNLRARPRRYSVLCRRKPQRERSRRGCPFGRRDTEQSAPISCHLRPSPAISAISGHLRPSPGPPSERGRSRKAHNRQRRCSSPAEPFQPTETRRRRKNVYILYFLPCTPQSLAALKDCRPVRLAVSFSGFLGIIARSCRQPPHGRVQGAFSARPLWGSAETRQSPPEARKSAFPAMLGFPATGKVVVRSLRKVPGFYSLKIARRSAPFLFLSSSCSYRKKYHLNKGVSGYR